MISAMEKQFILVFLKHCKSFLQLHQVHAYVITTGVLNEHPWFILPNILCTITNLAAANHITVSSSSHRKLMNYAVSVFDCVKCPSTFCYNTMIRVQTLLSSPASALHLFAHMRRVSVPPDFHTFPFAIKASGYLRMPVIAAALHSQALKFGFITDSFVLNSLVHVYAIFEHLNDACLIFEESKHKDIVSYNALIHGFVKAGDTKKAHDLFDEMSVRDCVSWGTLMAGYARMNQCQEAIDLFNSMLHSNCGICPDNVALVSVLSACAQLGDLEQGRAVHNYIVQNKIRVDSFLSTGLVDLYAKCGCIKTAIQIFETSAEKNLFTWNAILVGLAVHGHGKACLDYFYRMLKVGVQQDGVSFLGVLVGCSHAGLVCEARKLFESMEAVYGVPQELKHYGCMADLLGRAGLIREAFEMMAKMPIEGDVYVWGGLLAGCRKHGLVEIAEEVAKRVKNSSPEDGGVYSVMVDVYANSDMWDDVVKTRTLMKARKVKKNAGCSLIKLNGITHEFIAGDALHPQTDEIYMVLSTLGNHQFEA